MFAVALMSDPGADALHKRKTKAGVALPWSKVRIGQCIILLEIIQHIQKLSAEKKDPAMVCLVGLFQEQLDNNLFLSAPGFISFRYRSFCGFIRDPFGYPD